MTNLRIIGLAAVLLSSASTASAADKIDEKQLRLDAKQSLGALPKKMPEPAYNKSTPQKIELGKMLYFEPRLSLSQSISCNSCHNLAAAGDDGLPASIGHEAVRGGRNSPTVLNAGFQFAQFWDGRADTLESQAAGPITNPVEMAMPADDGGKTVLAVLRSIPEYRERFAKVFGAKPEPITMKNITYAVAAFERTLVSKGRFDKWLAGDNKALTAQEKQGLRTFLDVGCNACHAGPVLGGQMYQKAGLVKPWPNQEDLGRFEVTGEDGDKLMFKVPILRDIARTAPYFHDASAWTLDEAIRKMAEYQLGMELKDAQVSDIASFLGSLSGEPLKVTMPALPPRANDTPKPAAPDPALTPRDI